MIDGDIFCQPVHLEEITKVKAKEHSMLLTKYTTVSLTAVKAANSSHSSGHAPGDGNRLKKKKLTLRFFDQNEAKTWIRCLYVVMTKFQNVSDNLGTYLLSEWFGLRFRFQTFLCYFCLFLFQTIHHKQHHKAHMLFWGLFLQSDTQFHCFIWEVLQNYSWEFMNWKGHPWSLIFTNFQFILFYCHHSVVWAQEFFTSATNIYLFWFKISLEWKSLLFSLTYCNNFFCILGFFKTTDPNSRGNCWNIFLSILFFHYKTNSYN